mgnify:CR=1 FL=1
MITAALFIGFFICLFFSVPIALCLAGGGLLATALGGNVDLFVRRSCSPPSTASP